MREIFPNEYNVRLKKNRNFSEEKSRENYLKKYFGYKKLSPSTYNYKEQFFYRKLNEGDIFGGYVLFIENYPTFSENFSKEMAYTILADDVSVEVWIFEPFLLNYLAKSTLCSTFLDLIKNVDLPNEKKLIEENKAEIAKWHEFKIAIYREKMKEKFCEKKKRRDSYFI